MFKKIDLIFNQFFNAPDFGKLLLRLAIGGMLFLHGYSKIMHGVGFIEGTLTSAGLPSFLAYGVYVGEVFAPLLLILGIWVRPMALVVAGNMLVAWLLVHTHQTFMMSASGGWMIEPVAFFFFGALSILFLGAGRYSIMK